MGLFRKKVPIQALKEQGAIVVDVRTPDEFKAGHAKGSKNIPLAKLSGSVNELKKLNVPIICVCAVGMRAAQAKSLLSKNGIDAHNGVSWTKV